MDGLDWYQQLPALDEFDEITNAARFQRVPRGWSVIIADVVGSTLAISQGRYRDVNSIGAACIASVQNAISQRAFPYLFGGDGATLVLPNELAARARRALAGVAQVASHAYGLELRVGAVDLDELAEHGHTLELARLKLAGRQAIALLRGSAVSRAEAIVKRREDSVDAATMQPSASADPLPSNTCLDGLSCRWKPIESINGRILTILVAPVGSDPDGSVRRVLGQLRQITGDAPLAGVPVHAQNMSYRGLRELLHDELRMEPRWLRWSLARRVLEIVAAVLVFRVGIHPMVFSPGKYSGSMGDHCDYRKFDGTVQMVLDLSLSQCQRVREMLESLHREGAICFGLHESSSALMTCLVQGMGEGEHIHFVDGGEGGYAQASRQLKAQRLGR